ncbi:hypothetical protein [Gordonia amicalis]|uniref:Uncharacterized protein n=1 Tax=Gordonia phage MichaelScott TaxID=2759395 RepID=A0A7L7SIR0_9CAUD|nr:hypothetical protein [Gordonia amicalis]YP_010654613.1 hypothetical protein PP509_gp61 [Gordonia phage MichaelScott]MDJ0454386.1 hypothetical protein [Gordonia amicalis]MDV7077725.1 hypothetical protein [Gordonia amicalis]QOC56303.1 hypothetical protein SEA_MICHAELSCOTT_61 [Gordonia phage MichaelScott]
MSDQCVLRTRNETRLEIAKTLRREFNAQPATMAADDLKLFALSELVLRIAEGTA